MQSVQVLTAASKLASPNGSDWPSRPDRETAMVIAASRSPASFQLRSDGSTAVMLVTADG